MKINLVILYIFSLILFIQVQTFLIYKKNKITNGVIMEAWRSLELLGERPKEPLRYLCEYGGEV
jgi:hypothetical protein